MNKKILAVAIAATLSSPALFAAGGVPGTAVPNTFTAGSTAVAADVNANFSDLVSQAGANAGNITTNATNIATNTTDISTNATDITTNATDIASNTSSISTNTGNISTNTTNIASNATAISALQSAAPTVYTMSNYGVPVGTWSRTYVVMGASSTVGGVTTPNAMAWDNEVQTITKTTTSVDVVRDRRTGATTIANDTISYNLTNGYREFVSRTQRSVTAGTVGGTSRTDTLSNPEFFSRPPAMAVGQSWGGGSVVTWTKANGDYGTGFIAQSATIIGPTTYTVQTTGYPLSGTTFTDCFAVAFTRANDNTAFGGNFQETRINCAGVGHVASIRIRTDGSAPWAYELVDTDITLP